MLMVDPSPELLQEFELGLDPRSPERSRMPATVLGYGEISTVFTIDVEEWSGLAFKRLAIFRTAGELRAYQAAYEEYCRLLREEVGLRLPGHSLTSVDGVAARPIGYIVQERLPASSFGHRALHLLSVEDTVLLVNATLRELRKVWDLNRRQARVQVALDGQISNWCIEGFDPAHPRFHEGMPLWYVDTSTPLFRVDGQEQLDAMLFLRSAPPFLAWVMRHLFLEDVVGRYYDFRRVAIDLVANFYKEQRPDLVPALLDVVNGFFETEAPDVQFEPLREQEVRSYYREDAFIWSLYLFARKLDRFVRASLLRREYPYILPERIKR